MKYSFLVVLLVAIHTLGYSSSIDQQVFIKNKGQIASLETNQPVNDVLYYISMPYAKLFVTTKGLVYLFQKHEYNLEETEIPIAKKTDWQRVDVEFKNANFSKAIEGKLVGWHYNFFYAHCPSGIMNVPAFTDLTFEDIYKGIDFKLYIQEGKLKYDFVVKPFADIRQIELEYKYIDRPTVSSNGDVLFKTLLGEITETKPICFQDNRLLEGSSWLINGTTLRFNIPNYDRSRALIIDPFLLWSTYFGGGADEAAEGIAVNSNMIIVSGNTASTNFPTYNPGTGAYFSGSNTGLTDIFIAVFNIDGSLQWVTYFGGTKEDVKGKPIIVNDTYIYVSGQTNSTDIPTLNPGGGAFFQSSLNNTVTYDGFLMKFSIAGNLLWATYIGGSDQEELSALASTGQSLFAYVLTYSSDMPLVNPGGGAWQQGATNNNAHVYLMRFDLNTNALLWATYFGQSTVGMGFSWNSIACSSTHLYTAFNASDLNAPVLSYPGAYYDDTFNGGSSDLLISRFTENGVLEWSTYFGGNGSEEQRGITIANNKLWITGSTSSITGFPLQDPGNGAYFQNTYGGGTLDGFIASFSLDGQLLWSTYYGGSGREEFRDIKGDNYGVFITGRAGTDFPLYNPGTPTFYEPNIRIMFIAKFKQNGIRQWSTYFSGSGGDARKLAVSNDAVYMTGFVNNSLLTVDPGNGAYFDNTYNGGTWDAFIAKFDKCVIPTVSVTANQSAICKYDSTWLYATGGVSYLWNTTQTTDSIQVAPLNNSMFYVTVTDDMACSNNDSISITVYPLPDVNITGAHPICFNDQITLYANGAISYQWLPGLETTDSITVSPPTTTTYYLIGTDHNNCRNIDSAEVIVHPLPNVVITGEHPICFNDSIWLYAGGAVTYSWMPLNVVADSVNVAPLQTTMYYVTGTDVNGCKNIDSAQVVVYPLPNIQITGHHPICFGDSVMLYAHGGQTYFWSPINVIADSVMVSPQTTTMFYVLGTDSNMCKNIDSAEVVVYPLPDIQIQGAHPICFGDSITLQATGGVSYVWMPGSLIGSQQTFAPVQTSTYVVIGTDQNQCINTDTVSITVYQLPDVQISGEHPICFGDTITLTASGAVNYVWYPDTLVGMQQTFQPSTTQTYVVVGTDLNNCKNSDTAIVVVNPLPDVLITGVHPICYGDSITLTAINAQTFVWSTGDAQNNITVAPLQTTTYMVTGTDANGCVNSDTALLIVNPLPLVRINGVHPICLYDSITLTAAGAVVYTWSPWGYSDPSITVSPANTTQVVLTGTDSNGCVNSDSATLVVYPLPVVSISGVNPICFGDSITIIASGANDYVWTPGNLTGNVQTLSPQQTTTYTVLGIDTNQCKNTAQFEITVYELPVASISGISRICQMEEVTLTASGGTSYLWNTQQTTNSITVSPMTTTTYSVVAFKDICSDTAFFTITVDDKPVLTITNDTTIIIGMSVPLHVSGAQTYTWYPMQYLSCANCSNPTAKPSDNIEYCVIGTTAQGCSDTVCVQIIVDKECGETFVPSGFSPNNDGNNDVLYVRGKCIKSMQFVIYNRWGEKVFESTDPDIGWDGTFRGKPMDSGVFVYQLRAEYYNGVVVKKQGNVTLIR